jgi:hypothetical protein
LAGLAWLLLGRLLLLSGLLLGRLAGIGSLQRLCHNLVDLYVVILHGLFEKEVCCILFVFIAGKVGLGGLALRKSETLKALNCLHFLRSYSHCTRRLLSRGAAVTTKATSTGSSSVATRSTCHYQIHESHRICLDFCVKLRLVLLQSLHKFLEESWILKHSLPQKLELWVLNERLKV